MKRIVLIAAPVVWSLCCGLADSQSFERIISDTLDERPNCIENTNDGGYIIAGTQKDLPMT